MRRTIRQKLIVSLGVVAFLAPAVLFGLGSGGGVSIVGVGSEPQGGQGRAPRARHRGPDG